MTKYDVIEMMQCSALAYKNIQPTLPFERLTVIDDPQTDIQCYARQQGDHLSITFRGTNSKQDWLTDFTFWKKCIPYDNSASKIRVHSGFVNAYKNTCIRSKIHQLITPDIRFIKVAGHSYGAALAVLCAVDLEYNFPARDYEVYLFGCPRVGNRAFQKSYNKRVFKTLRVENGNDIVTKVPPAIWGYRHVGMSIPVGVPRLPFVLSLRQHRPQGYYSHFFMQLKP